MHCTVRENVINQEQTLLSKETSSVNMYSIRGNELPLLPTNVMSIFTVFCFCTRKDNVIFCIKKCGFWHNLVPKNSPSIISSLCLSLLCLFHYGANCRDNCCFGATCTGGNCDNSWQCRSGSENGGLSYCCHRNGRIPLAFPLLCICALKQKKTPNQQT